MFLKSLIFFAATSAFGQAAFSPNFVGILSKPPSGNPPAPLIIVTGQNLGTARNNGTYTVGFSTSPSSGIHITSLGRWVYSGNNQIHTIGVYNSSGTAIYTTTINMSGATPGSYFYVSIPPLAISGGSIIVIADVETGVDTWGDSATLTSFSADFSDPQSVFSIGGGAFSTVANNSTYVPVNATYTKP